MSIVKNINGINRVSSSKTSLRVLNDGKLRKGYVIKMRIGDTLYILWQKNISTFLDREGNPFLDRTGVPFQGLK